MGGKDVKIRCDGISKPARLMMDSLGEKIGEGELEIEPDSIIVLDTSSPELLGEYKGFLDLTKNIALIDHHSTCSFNTIASYRETRTSNSELVWETIGRSADQISRKALLAGILADTAHLRFANKETFGTISELLGEDIVFDEIFTIMKDDHDPSKVIALMKALQRMKVKRFGDYMVIKTNIGAYESFISKNIMGLGADVVIIVNDKKGERIVARANRSVVEKGVDLSKIMKDVGKKYGGEGGGHPPAAGLLGIKDYRSASEEIMNEMSKILK
jgi:nanoRNase/pAp phosphatase (c-di-AMP/oligoRNAs hydrolase)